MEVVAKALYLLNFYSGLSVCLATVWIISGLRSCRKNDTAPTPKLFSSWTWFHSSWFSWVMNYEVKYNLTCKAQEKIRLVT